MKLIVGLGNPGAEYDNTRHNIGFDVIDELSRKHNIPVRSMEKNGLFGIIYDDVTLDIGKIRLRPHGSAGGHNGIKSLINELGTQEFQRIRVGVGKKPVHYDLADWVLGHFKKEEREVMDKSVQLSAEAVESILDKGIGFAMNMYNGL